MRKVALSIASVAFLIAPAFAGDPQPAPQQPPADQQTPTPPAATPPPGSPDEMICKVRSEAAIGTKINKRIKICRTKREWDEETRFGQSTAERIQKSGGGQSGLLPMGPAGKGQPGGN
jgi:hypothetical protein